jgi:type VI secretion system secreted protein Hcp
MSRFAYSALAGSILLTAALPAFAGNIYCTVVGAKQGKFPADALRGVPAGIAVYALTEDIKVPYDASSGQSSARPQNSPVTIVKELDASSPLFFEAAVTNERLTSVACTFYRTTGGEPMHAYYRITLTNASVVQVKDSGDGVNGSAPGDELERISFTYQKIEVQDLDSNTIVIDDWALPG